MLTRKIDMSAFVIKEIDGKTGQVKSVIGLKSLFFGVGIFLILMATLMQINPFVFLTAYVAVILLVLCGCFLIGMSRSRIWKKTPAERLQLWNRQMEQGKFKNCEEFYYHYLASYYADIGDFEQALTHTLHAILLTEERETPHQKMLCVLKENQAGFLIDLGRYQEAAEIIESQKAKEDAYKDLRAAILQNRARLALHQQDVASAKVLIAEAHSLHTRGTAANRSWLLILQAELALAEGNLDETRQKADEVIAIAHASAPRHLHRAEQLKARVG